MAHRPLVISRSIEPGESFRHHGSIVFKTKLPNGVRAEAVDGGIVLEKGGGNNLWLESRASLIEDERIVEQSRTAITPYYDLASDELTIQIGEDTYAVDDLKSVLAARHPDDKNLSLGFKRVSGMEDAPDTEIRGISVTGALGHSVKIFSDTDVKIDTAGDRLRVIAAGTVTTGPTGRYPHVESGGKIYSSRDHDKPSP